MLDPTLKRGADTATTALSDDEKEDESAAAGDDDGSDRTLARRLTFFVSPFGLNLRLTGLSTINGDAGFHFLNEYFAIDGCFEISMDNIMPNVFRKSSLTGDNDPSSIKTLYRSIEAGAGWNFFGRWSDNSHVSFYQLRAGYKSVKAPEFTVRTDSLPPCLGGTVYDEDNGRLTLNTSQGTVFAGLAVVRKRATRFSSKTVRLYTDFLWSPYLSYEATDNDGDPYEGLTHALMLQHAGVRLGLERTRNSRFGMRWLLETGIRPGVRSANESMASNLYLSAKIGACSSWY